jgi:hypothetical protein
MLLTTRERLKFSGCNSHHMVNQEDMNNSSQISLRITAITDLQELVEVQVGREVLLVMTATVAWLGVVVQVTFRATGLTKMVQ